MKTPKSQLDVLDAGRPVSADSRVSGSAQASSVVLLLLALSGVVLPATRLVLNLREATASSVKQLQLGRGSPAQISVAAGGHTFRLQLPAASSPLNLSVTSNNPRVVTAAIRGELLLMEAINPGRSGLRIKDLNTHRSWQIGIRVLESDGSPPMLPPYVAIGSVSDDSEEELNFWRSFGDGGQRRFVDVRYLYLNGGPRRGWNTWGLFNGSRLVNYLRNSRQLGIVPFFVWYNIPETAEGPETAFRNIGNAAYMRSYFENLRLALQLIQAESPDDMVGMIIEPDFLGYMAQSGRPASEIAAATSAVYQAGLLDPEVDPRFAETAEGFVRAVNYAIRKHTPRVNFGWQVNLWASPREGWTTPIPRNGIIHKTVSHGIPLGRKLIHEEATAIASYAVKAGVASHNAGFIALDKYGLDAAGSESAAAGNPASSTWFWNSDLWGSFLTFSASLHARTGLPVVLWQMPCGHINGSLEQDPSGRRFPDLPNVAQRYEDSAATYFFGDRFVASGLRLSWFASNEGRDPAVEEHRSTIRWGSHMDAAAGSGIRAVLFGPGVHKSTTATGQPPGDRYWWMTKAQRYLAAPAFPPGNPLSTD